VHWYRYGNLGVQLFFIISGFVIVHSLEGKTLKEFATNRFVRLFPLFWALCTLTFVVTLIIPGAHPLSFLEYLISMTMVGDTINGFAHNSLNLIDPSYWTLTVELLFYIWIALFVHMFSYKHLRFFFAFWLAFGVLTFALHLDQNFYFKLILVRHASYFVFGGMLALIFKKAAQNLFEKFFDYLLLLLSAFYSVYIHSRALPPYPNANPFDQKIVTGILISFFILSVLFVYLSKFVTSKKLIKIFAVLGGVTYPLYLLHQTIGDTLLNFMVNHFSYPWDYFALAFEVFIILVAYTVFIKEKKFNLWLKSMMN